MSLEEQVASLLRENDRLRVVVTDAADRLMGLDGFPRPGVMPAYAVLTREIAKWGDRGAAGRTDDGAANGRVIL